MNSYDRIYNILTEGAVKQQRIALDKAKTAVGATASNDPKDPRFQKSMTTMHNSPEGQRRRRGEVAVQRMARKLGDAAFAYGERQRARENR